MSQLASFISFPTRWAPTIVKKRGVISPLAKNEWVLARGRLHLSYNDRLRCHLVGTIGAIHSFLFRSQPLIIGGKAIRLGGCPGLEAWERWRFSTYPP